MLEETAFPLGNFPKVWNKSTGTLVLRTYHGTESKVSTGLPPEQTVTGVQKPRSGGDLETEFDLTQLLSRGNLLASPVSRGHTMKTRLIHKACVAGMAILIATAILPTQAQNAPKRRPRIAVMDFDYATVQTVSAAVFGTNVDIGKGIVDLLVTGLVKDGSFSVIERKALDKILAEQNFSNSNRADANSAARIGKLLGVDAIVVGSITEFGNETKKTNLGGAGGNWHGIGLGSVGRSNSKANVAITARIIDVDTGEILGVADGKGQSSRASTNLLGGGGNWHGFGAGNADFGSSDFQQTVIGEATKQAVDQLSTNLAADSSKVVARTVTVEGVVAAVEGDQIVLNVGGKAGVKVGDQFNVVRVSKVIKDPTTGAVLRRLSTNVGVVKATDVDDVSAICAPVSGSGFKIGDSVKTVTQ
jgi:curli biogenesis system outer membrane secretion channel CsgG